MSDEKKICSLTAHEDIENHYPRSPITYFITEPDSGVDEHTGLILTISGFGWLPELEYEQKLRKHLADKYNCIVVGVEYFGIWLKRIRLNHLKMTDEMYKLMEKVFNVSISRDSGVNESELILSFINFVVSKGVEEVPEEYFLLNDADGCYQSFGLLPALDYLKVMAEVISGYQVDKKRIYVLGSSFGGYIALLMGKLAPKSFRLIVDNSGFSEIYEINLYGGGFQKFNLHGLETRIQEPTIWSKDPASDLFFDLHHDNIRDLKIKEHFYESDTLYYSAHSVVDEMAPFENKKIVMDIKPEGKGFLDAVDDSKIDGKLYKNTKHGMDASLRKLFEKAYNHYSEQLNTAESVTDFDLESSYVFPCSNGREYEIKFHHDDVIMSLKDQV